MRIIRRIFLLQIFLMFLGGIVSSQCTTLNFLNPSFEGPPVPHQTPPDWSNCNGTTSDTQPGSWGINAPPTNGASYLGMVAVPGWQETASQFISGCLTPGVTYTFTVDLATQLDNSSGGNCTGNLVLWGGNAGVTSGSACDFNTQLWNSGTMASGALFSTYTISITPTQNFCSLTWQAMETPGCSAGTFSVQLDNISPIVPFAVTPSQTNVTCFGGNNGTATVTPPATGGPFTYVWSPAPGGGQGTPTATGLSAGTYTVTVTNAAGCQAVQSFTITQPPSYTVTITNPGPITCGQNITLTANPAGGAGGNSFLWSPGGQVTPSITVSPGVNTNYTVTVTDANGCTATATTTVVVNCGCNITSFTGTPVNPNCVTGLYDVTGQIQFTGQPLVGTLTISGNCGGTQVFNAPFTSPINYNFTGLTANGAPCTVTAVFSGLPCTSTVNYTAPVTALLDPTITPAGPFCDNAAATTLTAADPGGTWSGTGITNTATGLFDPATAGAGLHTITYTIPGACGGTDTEQILVNATADATITPAGPFCVFDAPVNLVGADPGGTWSGNGITSGAAGTFDPGAAGFGTWTITYVIGGACGDVQTTNIVVTPQANATISAAGPFCENNPATFLTAVDPGGFWSGPGITDSLTGQFTPSAAGPGTHSVQYLIPGGCGDTSNVQIQVIQNADATITPVGPYCILDVPVTLTAVDPGGVWSGTGITNAATGIFDPGTAGAGTHVITYTISGVCGDAQITTITVTAQTPATITPAGPFCINANPLNLTAATPGGTWSGTGIVNVTAGSFNPATAGAGTHTITYITAGGCADTGTTNITVNPMPQVLFTGDTLIGCSPVCVDFSDLTTITSGNITQWEWNFGDGTVGTAQNPSHCFTNPTFNTMDFDVTLKATSNAGCATTQTINNMVTVYAIPDADFTFGPQPTTVMFPQIEFTNTTLGAATYLWTFDVYGTSTQEDPAFTFPDDTAGTYLVCLAATSTNGCIDNICHYVVIEEEFSLYVPNAFTPDGDGTNDIFIPVIKGYDINNFDLMIFNRWGEMVYSTENAANGWDGTNKNVKAKADVYVWKIKARDTHNERKSFYGHVSLLR